MKILKPRRAGFCMGVQRAYDKIITLKDKGHEKIYTLGPLFHNPQALQTLKARGIKIINDPGEITEGTLVIRTHGIPPQLRKKLIGRKDLKVVDLTCPRVARVQGIIKLHASRGYSIIIVGDEGHAEVVGLLGYATGKGIVIADASQVKQSKLAEKVCVVAQTTQAVETFKAVSDEILSIRPDAVIVDTLCDSTASRQEEASEMAKEADAIIVVGGKTSANTARLAQVCTNSGAKAYLIESASELPRDKLSGLDCVGITAGASTPSWVIDEVIEALESMK